MGVSSQPLQSSSLLPDSLQACFFLSFPITFNLSLFQAWLLLPGDLSQPSANVLIFSLVHLGFLWPSPSHTPLPQFLRISKWRGVWCTLKEGRKHPERSMRSLVHPVPMTAGKCVFHPSFHREHTLRGQSPLLPAVYKSFFKGLQLGQTCCRLPWAQQKVYLCFRGPLLSNFKPFTHEL